MRWGVSRLFTYAVRPGALSLHRCGAGVRHGDPEREPGDSGYFFWGWERLVAALAVACLVSRGLAAQVVVSAETGGLRPAHSAPLLVRRGAVRAVRRMSVATRSIRWRESRVQGDMLTL